MSKRTIFTTISPLPPCVSREVVVDFLHNHVGMIDLNPLVRDRHPINPPADAGFDEKHCAWYSLTDKIDYLPRAKVSGDVSYTCAFHDLPNGIQTHCRAPFGVDIRDKWTVNGTLPGEPPEPTELGIGAPGSGLYIREDVDLRCNILMTSFVKKNLKKSHAALVDRLVEKAKRASLATRRAGERASPGFVEPTPRPYSAQSHISAHAVQRKPLHDGTTLSPQTGSSYGAATDQPAWTSPVSPSSPPRDRAVYSQATSPPPDDAQAQIHAQLYGTSPPDDAQAKIHAQLYSTCPSALRAPVRTSPLRPCDVPAPLRIRGSSAGSNQAPHPASSSSLRSVPSSLLTTTTSRGSSSGVSSEQYEHPDYPHLSPYRPADGDSSPDEPLPRTPPFLVIGLGLSSGARGELDYPDVLRPGGKMGFSGRLNGPFVAELE